MTQSKSLGWFGHGIDPNRHDCTVEGSAVDLLEIRSVCEDGVDQEFNPLLVLRLEGFSTVVNIGVNDRLRCIIRAGVRSVSVVWLTSWRRWTWKDFVREDL